MFVFSIVFMKIVDNAIYEEFELNKKVTSKVFEFYYCDFELNIISAKLKVSSLIDRQSLLSNLEVNVYVFGQDLEYLGRIHLFKDNVDNQPFIQINKLINKQIFKSAINLARLRKLLVKIELIGTKIINEHFSLHF